MLDSLLPVLIAGIIGFSTMNNFFITGKWYEECYYFTYPVWVVFASGYLRVLILYSNWTRWQVVLYKISIMFCAFIFFYIGFKYMTGVYKFS